MMILLTYIVNGYYSLLMHQRYISINNYKNKMKIHREYLKFFLKNKQFNCKTGAFRIISTKIERYKTKFNCG